MILASIVVKLVLFSTGVEAQRAVTVTVFANLLLVSIGTFFGLRQFKIKAARPTSFKEDVKAGMRVASIYAIFLAVFAYFYYGKIDTTFFSTMIESRVAIAREAQANGQEVDLKNVRSLGEFIFSLRTHTTVTLFGFLITGTIYSLMISYFMRKFPGFK